MALMIHTGGQCVDYSRGVLKYQYPQPVLDNCQCSCGGGGGQVSKGSCLQVSRHEVYVAAPAQAEQRLWCEQANAILVTRERSEPAGACTVGRYHWFADVPVREAIHTQRCHESCTAMCFTVLLCVGNGTILRLQYMAKMARMSEHAK